MAGIEPAEPSRQGDCLSTSSPDYHNPFGAPSGIRTQYLPIMSRLLIPNELPELIIHYITK